MHYKDFVAIYFATVENNFRQPKIFRLRNEVFSILLFFIRITQNNAICINKLFFYCKIIFSDCLHIIYTCGSVLTSYATFLHRFYNLIFDRQYNCGYEDKHRPQNIYSRWNCVCNRNLSNKRQYNFRCPESWDDCRRNEQQRLQKQPKPKYTCYVKQIILSNLAMGIH